MTRINNGEAPMFTAHAWSAEFGESPKSVEFIDKHQPAGIDISAGWSTVDEDMKLIMIYTTGETGRFRILLNDVPIYDGTSNCECSENSLVPGYDHSEDCSGFRA